MGKTRPKGLSLGKASGTLDGVGANKKASFAFVFVLAVSTAAFVTGGFSNASAATSCTVFPSNNIWNKDISAMPVHSRSAVWLASMNAGTKNLHPDFGPSYGEQPVPYGIPYDITPASHRKIGVDFDYADESDRGPYPFGPEIHIEGGKYADGDRHAIMFDKSACKLYELYDAYYHRGRATAGSGAIFDLKSNTLRPSGWTSADAAGLPIYPGLLKIGEVKSGSVKHAIRFTAHASDKSYLWPARHQAGSANNANLPPMGARFRLKASFNSAGYSRDARVVINAFKRYGMILADNGSDWYFSGTQNTGWNEDLLDELKSIPASQFEAIDESSLMINRDSGRSR